MDVLDFKNNNLRQILEIVSKEQKLVFLLGDFNISLLNYNDHQPTNDFLDCLEKITTFFKTARFNHTMIFFKLTD